MRPTPEQSLSLIRQAGISLPEFYVLGTVGYDIVLTPAELARWTGGEVRGDRRGEFPIDVYEAAITTCIDRGWLTVLSEADCEQDAKRRANEPYPMCSVSHYAPGFVDFTARGASRYYALQEQLHRLAGQSAGRHLGSNVDHRGRIDVYCDDAARLTDHLVEIESSPEEFVGEPVAHIERGPIRTIAHWWLNRFQLIHGGFQAAVVYRAS